MFSIYSKGSPGVPDRDLKTQGSTMSSTLISHPPGAFTTFSAVGDILSRITLHLCSRLLEKQAPEPGGSDSKFNKRCEHLFIMRN
jgi:hypothetical protein